MRTESAVDSRYIAAAPVVAPAMIHGPRLPSLVRVRSDRLPKTTAAIIAVNAPTATTVATIPTLLTGSI